MGSTCDLGIKYSLLGWICVSRLYRKKHFREGRISRTKEAREGLSRARWGWGEGRHPEEAGRQGRLMLGRAAIARQDKREPLDYSDDAMVFRDQFYSGIT